jgi:hypothetical protein
MSKKRAGLNKQVNEKQGIQIKEQIAQKTKRVLFFLSMFLIAICLILLFRLGESLGHAWIIAHRTQIIGFLLLGIAVIILVSPLIIEVTSNARRLSGSDPPPWYGLRR